MHCDLEMYLLRFSLNNSQHTFFLFISVDFSARSEHFAVCSLTNVNTNIAQSQYKEIQPQSTQDQSLQRTKKEKEKNQP